jgi:hypothetical protein
LLTSPGGLGAGNGNPLRLRDASRSRLSGRSARAGWIGDYGLVGWNVVIMDSQRLDPDPEPDDGLRRIVIAVNLSLAGFVPGRRLMLHNPLREVPSSTRTSSEILVD